MAILTQICLQLWLHKEIKKIDIEISSPLFQDTLQHFITKAQLTHFVVVSDIAFQRRCLAGFFHWEFTVIV